MHRLAAHATSTITSLSLGRLAGGRLIKRVVTNFAEKNGLVYFGYVDQRDDDHHLVRGLTVSTTHRDQHYCIGSTSGYDLVFVIRTDHIRTKSGALRPHSWLIMEFDLHTPVDMPHVFIGAHDHNDSAYRHLLPGASYLHKSPIGTFGSHDKVFMDRYALYVNPSKAIEAERLLSPDITRIIGQNFAPLSIEIADGSLYLYAEDTSVNEAVLTTLLKNGLWLVLQIDARATSTQ